MNTSYAQKAFALAAGLATKPRDLWPYLRYLPPWSPRPVDCELPWFSFGAIRYLEEYLRPNHRVFEFGSSGSTLFFARRTAEVRSVENDPTWHQLIIGLLRDRQFTNATCEWHPLADDTLGTFQRSPFSQRLLAAEWDVIVIDCHLGFNAAPFGVLRPAAFHLALSRVAPGGLIVLDDSWMFPELLSARPGWEVMNFSGPGPCRYGITSTAIFRRMPWDRVHAA